MSLIIYYVGKKKSKVNYFIKEKQAMSTLWCYNYFVLDSFIYMQVIYL